MLPKFVDVFWSQIKEHNHGLVPCLLGRRCISLCFILMYLWGYIAGVSCAVTCSYYDDGRSIFE